MDGPRRYRRLLALLPRDFRERFADDMLEVFAHRLGEATGPVRRTWVWARALVDLALIAVQEWLRSMSERKRRGRMGTLREDVRYAARSLSRTPGLTLTVVATLALGIGSTTATFSVVDAVLLDPLPYRDADRLVAVWPETNFNASMLREMLARVPAFESATGVSGWTFTLTGQGEPVEVSGAKVSASHFRVLGTGPLLGRDFTARDALPGNTDVVILSHGFWTRVFGGDPDVVGRTIQLASDEHATHTVIGIMPAHFRPVREHPSVWVPLVDDPGLTMAADNTWYVNHRVARLAPGVAVEQAAEQVRAFARWAHEEMPRLLEEEDVRVAGVLPLREHVAGTLGPVLWAALGAVALVLLIASVNVANLLVARGEARARDLAVRNALGAGRSRVARMLLVESAALGLAGGAGGVALTYALVAVLPALAPADFPRLEGLGIDATVLGCALLTTLTATLLAGAAPSIRSSRVDATASLAGSARAASSRRGSRLASTLVGVEVALAVVVVVGSGLMVRSLLRMTGEEIGLETQSSLVFRASPPLGAYPDGPAFHAYYSEVLERVGAIAGVERVGAIQLLPGTTDNWSFPTYPEGVDMAPGSAVPSANIRLVFPGYFETVGMAVSEGRSLEPTDRSDSEPVVAVNRAFVDRFWPGLDPLGRTLRIMGPGSRPYRVVGVVENVRQHGLGSEPRAEMYFSHAQLSWSASFWVVARIRDGADPLDYADAIRAAVWSIDADVPVTGLDVLSRVFSGSASTTRFVTAVLATFGALALLLAAVGVFGVTAYTTGRRTAEFGVRIALGASRTGVLRSALAGTSVPVAFGLVAGLAAASGSTRVLRSALYQVEPTDPITFAAVSFTLLAVATAASLIPANRASRIDPVSVLNSE